MSDKPGLSDSVQLLRIDADQAGQRIDNYLIARLKGVPRSRIYRLLRKGEVRVNKGRIKPTYRLMQDDLVRVPPVRQASRRPMTADNPLGKLLKDRVLLETKDYLVLDKPAGVAVHGGSGISAGVIEALRAARPEEKNLELVHRLDRDTSGCLLLARRRGILRELQAQMRDRHVDKRYVALVSGRWPRTLTEINAPLRKFVLSGGERMVRPDKTGKAAVTEFALLAHYLHAASEVASLIDIRLLTGRTHQIRVHCQLAGYPLAGDEKYGDRVANARFGESGLRRLFLHASALGFSDPATGARVEVSAPLPDDLSRVLDRLSVAAPESRT